MTRQLMPVSVHDEDDSLAVLDDVRGEVQEWFDRFWTMQTRYARGSEGWAQVGVILDDLADVLTFPRQNEEHCDHRACWLAALTTQTMQSLLDVMDYLRSRDDTELPDTVDQTRMCTLSFILGKIAEHQWLRAYELDKDDELPF